MLVLRCLLESMAVRVTGTPVIVMLWYASVDWDIACVGTPSVWSLSLWRRMVCSGWAGDWSKTVPFMHHLLFPSPTATSGDAVTVVAVLPLPKTYM